MELTLDEFLRRTVPPSQWNPRTLSAARIAYEKYRQRVILYGDPEIRK